jgi:hypothetical protein
MYLKDNIVLYGIGGKTTFSEDVAGVNGIDITIDEVLLDGGYTDNDFINVYDNNKGIILEPNKT